jgi:hypothetical protein
MLYIENDGVVRLTRGDTARISVSAINEVTNEPYIFESGDTLTLTVKKSTKDVAPLVQKIITGSNTFSIDPADTSSLSFGKYKYDVELKNSNGDVYTIIEPTIFEILPEVTY